MKTSLPSGSDLREILTGRLVGRDDITCSIALDCGDGNRAGLTVSLSSTDGENSANSGEPCYMLYSISKVFIATAILRRCQRQELSLDTRIDDTGIDCQLDRTITIRHLLEHTSGLPDYGGMSSYHQAVEQMPNSAWSQGRFLEVLSQLEHRRPGKQFHYSNLNYLLLKMILERLSQKSFQAILEEELFIPLGMTETFVAASRRELRRLQPAGSTLLGPGEEQIDIRAAYDPGWVSHGVVCSTARETALFLQHLSHGDVIASPLLERMMEGVDVAFDHPLFQQPQYGLGLMIGTLPGGSRIFGHSGQGPGYSCSAYWVKPADGKAAVSIAVLTNEESSSLPEQLLVELAAAAYQ